MWLAGAQVPRPMNCDAMLSLVSDPRRRRKQRGGQQREQRGSTAGRPLATSEQKSEAKKRAATATGDRSAGTGRR